MRRAVVIGATGQIGRPTVDALVRDGWEVTAASRGGGRDERWADGVRAVRLDREDDAGRGFDTQGEPDGFPGYPVPIPETQPTVAPGEATYSTRKAALERELL